MDRLSGPDGAPGAVLDEAMLQRDHGLTSESLAVLRALADIIVPAVDGYPAASEMGAHLHTAESLELLQRGSSTLLTRLLNMYARAQRRDARFLELDSAERERALRALAEEDLDELRDLVEVLHAFTLNGYLAGWSASPAWAPPPAWKAMGYHGPADGHLDLVGQGAIPPTAERADDA